MLHSRRHMLHSGSRNKWFLLRWPRGEGEPEQNIRIFLCLRFTKNDNLSFTVYINHRSLLFIPQVNNIYLSWLAWDDLHALLAVSARLYRRLRTPKSAAQLWNPPRPRIYHPFAPPPLDTIGTMMEPRLWDASIYRCTSRAFIREKRIRRLDYITSLQDHNTFVGSSGQAYGWLFMQVCKLLSAHLIFESPRKSKVVHEIWIVNTVDHLNSNSDHQPTRAHLVTGIFDYLSDKLYCMYTFLFDCLGRSRYFVTSRTLRNSYRETFVITLHKLTNL